MEIKTLKKKWTELCMSYTEEFCKKHKMSKYDMLDCDILIIDGNCINYEDIRYDINNDIEECKFSEWYDKTQVQLSLGFPIISFKEYCEDVDNFYNNDSFIELQSIKKDLSEYEKEFDQLIGDE